MRELRELSNKNRLVLLFLFLAVGALVAIIVRSSTYDSLGTRVGVTQCYQARDEWRFCNTRSVRRFVYVDVYHDAEHVELLSLPMGSRKEYQGYVLRYIPPDLYVYDSQSTP